MKGRAFIALLLFAVMIPCCGFCQRWDTTGCSLRDTLPTQPCGMGVASADSLSTNVKVWWTPSPDSDIAGYYLCEGNPCIGLDTIWGRMDTTYTCATLSPVEPHQFRVLAFDSCFKASPLTQRFGNLVMQARLQGCPLRVETSWRGYDTLPGGIGGYHVLVSLDGEEEHLVAELLSGEKQYIYPLNETDSRVAIRIAVVDVQGKESVWSNRVTLTQPVFDSSWVLAICETSYDEQTTSVTLNFEVQPGFEGEHYALYRGINGRAEVLRERFDGGDDDRWSYQDADLGPRDTLVGYRIERVDSCGRVRQTSDIAMVQVPLAAPTTAYFPNIFTPEGSSNNLFRGTFVSVLPDDFELRIYNRMGLLVFFTRDIQEAWDGTLQGRPMPTGTYVYQAICRQREGGLTRYTGNILLVR